MPAALKALEGYLTKRVLVLPSTGPFLIGRSPEADLTLFGPELEDRQVVLVPDGGGHRIVPVASRHPTRVKGEVLRAARVLRDGDVIKVGRHVFAYAAAGTGEPGGACASCGAAVEPGATGALALAKGVVCQRCVDRRLSATRELERYRVLRKAGLNEEELTYLAVDKEESERVALRILKAERQADPRRVRRFLARALVGMVVDHPNFASVRAIQARRGVCFVVLDWHEGVKLERLVRERAPLAPAAALVVANQLAGVLLHARGRKLVVAKRRRTGVIIDRRLWVKVMAFDLTPEVEAAAVATAAFREVAARCGFDPDLVSSARPIPPKNEDEARLFRLAPETAEVFSVGRILYQLITNKPFQPGPTLKEIRAAATRPDRRPKTGATGLDAAPPELVLLLDRILVPTGPDRLTTLDALGRASTNLLVQMDAPAALESGDLDLDGVDDADEEPG
jgi:hypothetical protein